MKKLISFLAMMMIVIFSFANNVVISNISLITSGGPGNYRVQFDLSWDNGWRVSTGQNNYDGVWVFFKFRVGGGEWQHLTMTGTGNLVPANYTAYQNTGATKTGAIIHRTNDFTGTTTLTDIELGVSDITGFDFDISGYAIEMVFIPQCGNCILGDGNGSTESINSLHVADNTSGPFGSTFSVDGTSGDDATLQTTGLAINAAGITGNPNYPTGQAAWCMKYELSQGGYRDFLNSLTLTQQATRTSSSNPPTSVIGTGALIASGTGRNFIEIATPSTGGAPAVYGCDASGNNVFDEADDGEWVGCNFVSWMDIAAYLDWAGLAPMTEIVYERICRGASTTGANPSVLGEYAWGTTGIFVSPYALSASFTANEFTSNSSPTLGNANYNSNSPEGPSRNGVFATTTSNRITSGAAFYGVMEMTGNLLEACVSVGNVAGRGFTGLNGNGILSGSGNANVANWPCGSTTTAIPACGEVTDSKGVTLRGGGHNATATESLATSRRAGQIGNTRSTGQGCRGVLYIN